MPESYSNWMKKLERAQKFAATMVKRLSEECGKPIIIKVVGDDPIRPSLSGTGFEMEVDGAYCGTWILPAREAEWKPFLDQLSFALRWHKEKSEKPAEAAV